MEEVKDNPSYYAIIPSEVRYANITPNAKILFAEITALSNKEGYCWTTNKYFANLYATSNRSIQNWIKELEINEFIKVELVDNNARKIYVLGGKNLQGGMKKSSRGYEKNFTPLLIYNNKNNNNNIYIEKTETESLPFTSEKFIQTWNNFKTFRKELKHPITKTSIAGILNKLKNFTEEEAIKMLNMSIENGWRGVFPLREVKTKVSPVKISNFDNKESGFTNGTN